MCLAALHAIAFAAPPGRTPVSVKIHLLGGTAQRGGRRKPSAAGAPASTRDRGVLAIGDGTAAEAGAWALVNISPTVAQRLDLGEDLAGPNSPPDSAVPAATRTVLLTDAQVDHVAGLLSLRDGAPIDLYCTPAVFEDLSATLPVLSVLQHYCGVHWHLIPVAGDRRVAGFQVEGLPTLEWTAIAIDAPAPPFSQHADHPVVGDTIALAVRDTVTGQRVFCAPGLVQIGALEFDWMREADCVLLDHPQQHQPETAQALADLPARHKVLLAPPAVPSTDAAAPEGFALAYDGMEIHL
jgi:pyrroloquinoline quinone biosynthesis protein B